MFYNSAQLNGSQNIKWYITNQKALFSWQTNLTYYSQPFFTYQIDATNAAKVFLRYDNVTFFHIFDKVLVNILHAVSRQFCWVGRIQVSCGNDNICIHVIPEFENYSFCVVHFLLPLLFYFSSQGQEILPVIALAAATAGLAR